MLRRRAYFTKVQSENSPEFVDLGLPSGTLWADRNVGAETIDDFGLYFAWGEIEGVYSDDTSRYFNWNNYKFGTMYNTTKYNSTDHKTVLDLEDDAAYMLMGPEYIMPTKDQISELCDNTSQVIIQSIDNPSVKLLELTSTLNGNKLYLPLSGIFYGGSNEVTGVGSSVCCWARNINTVGKSAWRMFQENSAKIKPHSTQQAYGQTIRPVAYII